MEIPVWKLLLVATLNLVPWALIAIANSNLISPTLLLCLGVAWAGAIGLAETLLETQTFTLVARCEDLTREQPDDFVSWGSLTQMPNGCSISSHYGYRVTVSLPSGDLVRCDQGENWAGNFAPGAQVLWTAGNLGPLSVEFETPVYGAGTQIQVKISPEQERAFTAVLEGFDSSNKWLGSLSLAGLGTDREDNSAIFIGAISSTPIARLTFNVQTDEKGANDFAIGQLQIREVPVRPLRPSLFSATISTIKAKQQRQKLTVT